MSLHLHRNLGNIPLELLDRIIYNIAESRWTLRSLRLTCRRFNGPAAHALFHEIHLSPLVRDREAFLRIAQAPHLACHVRILTWEEIPEDSDIAQRAAWKAILQEDIPNPEEVAEDITWLRVCGISNKHASFENTLESFLVVFEEALLALPGLRTICVRPMHPCRKLRLSATSESENGYFPIPAHHVQRQWGQEHNSTSYNRGFFRLLAPALANLAKKSVTHSTSRQTPLQVNHLRLCFDSDQDFSGLGRSPLATFGAAFANLTHVDMCIMGSWQWRLVNQAESPGQCPPKQTAICNAILSILQDALDTITHMHLCSDRDKPGQHGDISMLRQLPRLTRLKVLDLSNVHHEDTRPEPKHRGNYDWDDDDLHKYEADVPSALADFVHRHVSTLREVYIRGAPTYLTTVAHLSKIQGLKLDKFEVDPFRPNTENKFRVYDLNEGKMLEFLHGQMPDNFNGVRNLVNRTADCHGQMPDNRNWVRTWADTAVRTCPSEFEEQMTLTAMDAYEHLPYWSRRPHGRRMESWGHEDRQDWEIESTWVDEWGHEHEYGGTRVMVKPSHLWEDGDGFLYDPRIDQILGHSEELDWKSNNEQAYRQERLDRLSNSSGPWWKKGDRTWDRDTGLWKSPTGWHRFATARDPEEAGEGIAQKDDLSDILVATAPWTKKMQGSTDNDGEEGDTSLEHYHASAKREHFSNIRRQRASFFWDFGRAGKGENAALYYRPGHNFDTQVWLFKHRNGEEAYGTEPLDYFSDWEGSQVGDIYEPTPYGWNLHDSAGELYNTLDEISPEILDDHGRSWVKYDRNSDPMEGPPLNDLWFDIPRQRGSKEDDELYCIDGYSSDDSHDTGV